MSASKTLKTLIVTLITMMLLAGFSMSASAMSTNTTPFYGVWVGATTDQAEAENYASTISSYGFNAQVFITTDWSNLNPISYYVITAGVYYSESDAYGALSSAQYYVSDAYVKYSGDYQGSLTNSYYMGDVDPGCPDETTPFYGIWVGATVTKEDADAYALTIQGYGFQARVFLTTDWSNLNTTPYYVITAGVYYSEDSAYTFLSSVQAYVPDAYVKYSGDYQGSAVANDDSDSGCSGVTYITVGNISVPQFDFSTSDAIEYNAILKDGAEGGMRIYPEGTTFTCYESHGIIVIIYCFYTMDGPTDGVLTLSTDGYKLSARDALNMLGIDYNRFYSMAVSEINSYYETYEYDSPDSIETLRSNSLKDESINRSTVYFNENGTLVIIIYCYVNGVSPYYKITVEADELLNESSGIADWAQAYTDYINNNSDVFIPYEIFQLIDLDGDGIPELFHKGNFSTGTTVITYDSESGTVREIGNIMYYFDVVEGQGYIRDEFVHSGAAVQNLYLYADGELNLLGEDFHFATETDRELQPDISEYDRINGEETTHEGFMQLIADYFGSSESIMGAEISNDYPAYISTSEILAYLAAADVYTAQSSGDTGIEIAASSWKLLSGQSFTLKLKGTDEDPVWSSDDESVAFVTKHGRVKAKSAGTAVITASLGDSSFSCTVEVSDDSADDFYAEKIFSGELDLSDYDYYCMADITGDGTDELLLFVYTTYDKPSSGVCYICVPYSVRNGALVSGDEFYYADFPDDLYSRDDRIEELFYDFDEHEVFVHICSYCGATQTDDYSMLKLKAVSGQIKESTSKKLMKIIGKTSNNGVTEETEYYNKYVGDESVEITKEEYDSLYSEYYEGENIRTAEIYSTSELLKQ